MHYCPNIDIAFNRVRHICRDVNHGWLLRHTPCKRCLTNFRLHLFALGAKLILRIIKLHTHMISRSSNSISTIGYVLPRGQISFWGATVIANFYQQLVNQILVKVFGLSTCLREWEPSRKLPDCKVWNKAMALKLDNRSAWQEPITTFIYLAVHLFTVYFLINFWITLVLTLITSCCWNVRFLCFV